MSPERHDSASTTTLADIFSARNARGTLSARDESPGSNYPKTIPSLFARIVMIMSSSDLSIGVKTRRNFIRFMDKRYLKNYVIFEK